jgi:hypothetical protein
MTTLLESQFLDKLLSDKQKLKQLSIAWRHDSTVDPEIVATLGPKMSDEEIARRWSAMLDQKLNNLGEPEMLTDPKYKEWMTKLYTTGVHHSSQITSRLPYLEGWHLLSVRGLLKPEHTDLNRFRSADILQRIIEREYLSKLDQIRRDRELEKLKKDIREIVLIDNNQFRVAIPLNYAACYRFNYTGHNSRYCTGASDGRSYFANYSDDGPIVTVIDKKNVNKADGKWQLHAASSQIANSTQQIAGASADRKFAQLYPGLLKQILAAMQARAEEIRTASIPLVGDDSGYDMPKVIKSFAKQFPNSFKSEPVDEQTLLESSTVLTQFKDLPSAEKMILPMHKAGRLPHDTKLFNTTKLDVKRLRDKIRHGEGVSFVIFVRGTQDLGILTMGVYINSAYVYQDNLIKKESKSIGELVDWLKTYIGKIVDYSIAQSPSVAVQRVKVKRERLKPLPQTTAPFDIATTFINKLKPLVVRNLERAVADIKGYVNTLIKSSNYDRAANKIAILKQLEKKLEDIEATGNYDDTYIMSKMLNAIHAAALYHYPEHGEQGFQDRPATVYPGFRSSGSVTYTPLRDTTGVKQLMTDIARGDVKKVGTVLAFFRDELVKPL